jgi:hypothetical protein
VGDLQYSLLHLKNYLQVSIVNAFKALPRLSTETEED